LSPTENSHGWRKSARCGSGTCVEVRRTENDFEVRDSKNPDGPVLRFTGAEWDAFMAGVAAGDFAFD